MAKWVKRTSYGDYRDPLQNHKFDNAIKFYDNDNKIVSFVTKQHTMLHQSRTLGIHGKHVGSKPLRNLLNPLNKFNKMRAAYKKLSKSFESLKASSKQSTTKEETVSENTD